MAFAIAPTRHELGLGRTKTQTQARKQHKGGSKRRYPKACWGAGWLHTKASASRMPDLLSYTRDYARKLLVDIAKGHFAALQKNILQR
jgi:hypothetical protein